MNTNTPTSKNQELPVIALKNMVLFPRIVVPLMVQRPKSMAALDAALNQFDKLAVFVTQKNIDDEIKLDQVFKIGVIGKINSVLKMPGNAMRIEVEGIEKAEILDYLETSPYLKAKVNPLKIRKSEKAVEIQALMRHIHDRFIRLMEQIGRPIPNDVLSILQQVKEPEPLMYLVITNLNLDLKEQQNFLEISDVKQGLKKASVLLNRELEIVETEKRVVKETHKQLNKMQKEIFLREQMKSIEKELGLEGEKGEMEGYRRKIREANMPPEVEAKAMKELERLEKMPSFSPEVSYLRTYLDWMVDLPWANKTENDLDLKRAEKILNEDHYGLDKVKERILEYLAVQKQVGKIKGPILCFAGPPGTGKTSIGKSIARALGRKFHKISLGGIRDEAEIRGHRRTYVGALPGRIIQGMNTVKVKNPIFMLDEIDKIGADFRGDPSAALLEALDPEQNYGFSDHYLEVPFDLSDVMFITTANVLDTIPPALRDRLEIIEFPGYTEDEKFRIAKKFLLPKLNTEHGFKKSVEFDDKSITEIIRKYTREAGVRNLEREFSKILRKVVRKLVENQKKTNTKITYPSLKDYLGPERFSSQMAEKQDEVGVVTGLSWTPVGGEVISIEAMKMTGKGKLILTGRLGKVMQESIQAAFSFARGYLDKKGIKEDIYSYDVHVHVPSGAIPKDGPSGGVAMATALISLFTNKKIEKEVGMTGEITLRGKVLEIGGVKEKVLAAHRVGLKTVILPKENQKDIVDVPEEARKELKFVFAETMDDVLRVALK